VGAADPGAAGLVVTFAAGLWNIGIEGQIVAGAIAATWVARERPGPAPVLIPLMLLAGLIGGALWALLAGVLKTRGGVNEIFGGLGLDFVASGVAIYLNHRAVEAPGHRVHERHRPVPARGLAADGRDGPDPAPRRHDHHPGLVVVYVLMRGTRLGLRLKAVGKNARSASLLGIPTERYTLGAFALCGALAGIAGAIQAAGVHHKLVPSVSGGYGFLGILVVLLAGYRAAWIAPISLFFAAVAVGSTQLSLRLSLDSSLGGVLQGVLVLLVILAGGWQARRALRARAASTPPGEP